MSFNYNDKASNHTQGEPGGGEHCPNCTDDREKREQKHSEFGYGKRSDNVSSGTPGHKGEQEYFPALAPQDSVKSENDDTYVPSIDASDEQGFTDGSKENNSYE